MRRTTLLLVATAIATILTIPANAYAQGHAGGDRDRSQVHDPMRQIDRDMDRTQDRDRLMERDMDRDRAQDRARDRDRVDQPASGTQARQQQQIYGQDLMTDAEREQYRRRYQELQTEQERAQFREQHIKKMQERARERGVTLPSPAEVKPAGQG